MRRKSPPPQPRTSITCPHRRAIRCQSGRSRQRGISAASSRSPTFERDLCEAIGATFHEESFASAEEAWPRIAELLRGGDFPLVYTDLFYLPYVGAHGHWFGHLVVIAGPQVRVWDNEHEGEQVVPRDALLRALGSGAPVQRGAVPTGA